MIHRDAHHLGIAAIAGNHGNGEFKGPWLALGIRYVGMSKTGGLARHVAEREGLFPLIYARGARRQRASHGPKPSDANVSHVFPKPVFKVGDTPYAKVGSRLDAFPNRSTTSTMLRTRPPVACSA
ncbi:uncharacterized protein TNCV_1905511 [Trichonephila clavipes]|nr:uncharacterized protein TNCV_1905511 [Trichonephila clavipes]